MGFFSWMTADTNESISNSFSSRGTFPVTVLCPDGTKITEENYEGYGEFDGKDIYQLVAEWNAPGKCDGDVEHDRMIGIDISDVNDTEGENLKYPIKIVRDFNLNYDDVGHSPPCPEQGYFYNEGEE